MSLRNQVNSVVQLAFNAIGDLATDVILSKKTNGGYDFTNRENIEPAETQTTVKGFVEKKTNREGVVQQYLIFQTSSAGNVRGYDSATIAGIKYGLGPDPSDDGFITKVEIFRG